MNSRNYNLIANIKVQVMHDSLIWVIQLVSVPIVTHILRTLLTYRGSFERFFVRTTIKVAKKKKKKPELWSLNVLSAFLSSCHKCLQHILNCQWEQQPVCKGVVLKFTSALRTAASWQGMPWFTYSFFTTTLPEK